MTEATAQVEVFNQQLELAKEESAKLEECAVSVDEEASLLKEELPQRLFDAVEEFKDSEAIEKQAAL